MKPKVALIKDGKVPTKLGKGRMNAAQIARCMELVAQGWVIEGYTSKVSDNTTAPVVTKEKSEFSGVADVPPDIRREDDWDAFIVIDGKSTKIGMRTVCNGPCRSSLTNCYCEKSRVWDGRNNECVVTYKPRTSPLPAKRW